MITDNDLALLCQASYDPGAVWDHAWTADDIHVTHKMVEGVSVIVFRGSIDVNDWLADFDALPHKHPRLGWCHAGFLRYLDLVFENIMAVVGRDIIVTGHSLGAARASLLAGLLLDHGSQVMARVTFGEPRPAFKRLGEIIGNSGCISRSYRNGIDPVPLVPAFLWPLLPYQHVTEPLAISNPPDDSIVPSFWHSIDLYAAGAPPAPVIGGSS